MLKRRPRPTGLTWAALAIAATGALASCTGGSDEAAPIPTVQLTTSTVPTTTTTTEPTTTAPPTTEDPNVAEIMTAAEGYFYYLPNYGLTVNREVLERFTADPLLTRLVTRFSEYEAAGATIDKAEYQLDVIKLEVDGERATLTSCNLDAISTVSASGEELVPADEVRYLRITEFQLLDQGWRVIDTAYSKGKAECEV